MNLSGIVFQQPVNLCWLFAVPIFILLFLGMLHYMKLKLEKFGEHSLIKRITPENSRKKLLLKFYILLAAYVLIVTDLAKPEFSFRHKIVQATDLMIVLDVSQSMLTTDIKPNRLESAKSFLEKLSSGLTNTRLGLVPFAGQSIVLLPLTADKKTLLEFLAEMTPETIPVQGTLIAPALELAVSSFSQVKNRTKIILLVTDGEDHEQQALETAQLLKKQGIHLLIYGIGSDSGGMVPVFKNDKFSHYKTDQVGKLVISKVNKAFLDSLAEAVKGKLFMGGNDQFLNHGISDPVLVSDEIKKEITRTRSATIQKVEQINFPVGLMLSLMLLLSEFILSEKKNGNAKTIYNQIRSKLSLVLLLILMLLPDLASAQVSYYTARKGNKAYEHRNFALAERLYSANAGNTSISLINFNRAAALYQQSKYVQAAKIYTLFILSGKPVLHQVWYNLGNCLFMQHEYALSIAQYVNYLHTEPHDHAALYNLAYARYMLHKNTPPPKNASEVSQPSPSTINQEKVPQRSKINRAALKNALEKSQSKSADIKGHLEKDW